MATKAINKLVTKAGPAGSVVRILLSPRKLSAPQVAPTAMVKTEANAFTESAPIAVVSCGQPPMLQHCDLLTPLGFPLPMDQRDTHTMTPVITPPSSSVQVYSCNKVHTERKRAWHGIIETMEEGLHNELLTARAENAQAKEELMASNASNAQLEKQPHQVKVELMVANAENAQAKEDLHKAREELIAAKAEHEDELKKVSLVPSPDHGLEDEDDGQLKTMDATSARTSPYTAFRCWI